MKKVFAIMLLLVTLLLFAVPVVADAAKSDDIVILYTNDVHTYMDGALSYDVLAGLKDKLEQTYARVLLVDAGDHIQGTAYGSMDKGKTIIDLMNAAGYDAAALGNHEFDYGMEGRIRVTDVWAEYPYLSCNFYREANGVRGENVLDSYALFDCGEETIAIVGVTTPETFHKSTPAYFRDENGNFIYGISGGSDGAALQADLQAAIDAAEAEGATMVIGLGHLGVDASSAPWTSEETIGGVSGLDAFIDGHSHSAMENVTVADKDGANVLLTQTGEYFNAIGMMVIDPDTDAITTELLTAEDLAELTPAAEVKAIKDRWLQQIETELGATIGTFNVTLDNYDEDGHRLVRSQETNTGDFAADALYYLFDHMDLDVDVAVMNGGGIRNKALTGDVSYKICKDIHTFGNVACLQTITGRQLLDALEWGARGVGTGEEIGGFLHVSGLTYRVDPSVESTVRKDANGTWAGAPTGAYRVHDVQIYNKESDAYEPLDLNASYNLAGYNYTLRDLGDGFAMFDGAVNVLDYVMEDYLVLANYVQGFEDCAVDAYNSPLLEKYPGMLLDYGDVNGCGRIRVCACVDADRDHSCDICWETMSECTDEAPHDHFCDICGDIFWEGSVGEGASANVTCDGCGAKETYVDAAFTSLEYWMTKTGVLADVTLNIHAKEAVYGDVRNRPVSGTVTVSWEDPSGDLIEEHIALNGEAEVVFYDMPVDMLNHGTVVFLPEDAESYMPSSSSVILAYDGYTVYAEESPLDISINGIETDELILLPGTEVVVGLLTMADGTFHVSSACLEGQNIPIGKDEESRTITFRLPEEKTYFEREREVDLTIVWTCDCGCVCRDDWDSNHICDQCEHVLGVCKVYNEEHYCVRCGSYDYSALMDDFKVEAKAENGTIEVSWTALPVVQRYEYDAEDLDSVSEYIVTVQNESLGVDLQQTVSVGQACCAVFNGLKNGETYEVLVEAEYPKGKHGRGYGIGRGIVVEMPAAEEEPSERPGHTPIRKPAVQKQNLSDRFIDLDSNAWYNQALEYVLQAGLMNGVGADRFDPYGTTNRAMVVTILWRLEAEPAAQAADFSDVEVGSWYADAVNWAASEGIVEGYGDGGFGPMAPITREQLAVILWRYAKYQGMDVRADKAAEIHSYIDGDAVSDWAYAALQWACGSGVVNGKDGALAPQDFAVRAETAQMLFNFMQ